MNLNYKIKLFSGWHCGSGLSAGADVDSLAVKDANGLPFVPGKTVKGLLFEAVEEYAAFTSEVSKEAITQVFGHFDDKDSFSQGIAFFSNAELSKKESEAIVANQVQDLMYRRLSATAIGENGVAVDHSLRCVEVAIPCELEGRINDIPDDFVEVLKKSARLVKRLGSWRNRGLGRCDIIVEEGK